jgi:hypothetical protein
MPRILHLMTFLSPRDIVTCLQQRYQRKILCHTWFTMTLHPLRINLHYLKTFKYQGEILVRWLYSLESIPANTPKAYLYDGLLRRKWMMIYASRSCLCQTCIYYYQDYSHIRPRTAVMGILVYSFETLCKKTVHV